MSYHQQIKIDASLTCYYVTFSLENDLTESYQHFSRIYTAFHGPSMNCGSQSRVETESNMQFVNSILMKEACSSGTLNCKVYLLVLHLFLQN
jgi:hypothetical protein